MDNLNDCLEGSKGFKLGCQHIGVLLDVPVDFHGSDFVEARRDFTSAGVIRTVKQFEVFRVGCKEVLFIENGEVEVI